jgi:NADH-quinone oxidoreductase subunit C
MDQQQLKDFVGTLVPNASFSESGPYLAVTIDNKVVKSLLAQLEGNQESNFDFLFCLTGVDYPENIEVIYHLRSTSYNHVLVVKTRTSDRKSPVLESVCDLWKTAEFHEREIFDLLGVRFNGHPDLRRIFLDEAWEGFPLRKDYKDEFNIVER